MESNLDKASTHQILLGVTGLSEYLQNEHEMQVHDRQYMFGAENLMWGKDTIEMFVNEIYHL